MTRTDLQHLARVRLADAEVLLAAGQWDGAYYLAGYAVECALKALIARKTVAEEFHDKQRATDSFTHNLTKLTTLADIADKLVQNRKTDPKFDENWVVVLKWNETSLYRVNDQKSEAEEL